MAGSDAMRDETKDAPPELDRRTRWIEIFSAVLLSLGAVAVAWSGYQAARWGGVQATATADGNAARLESSRAATTGGQLVQIDVGTFFQAVNAFAAGDEELVGFYVERMRPEFRPVFDEWVALDPLNNQDAPLSPFELGSYTVAEVDEAERLEEEAQAQTDLSRDARSRANNYTISVVLFAAAVFFAGISTKFSSDRARIGLLGLGAILFVGVVIWIGTLPKSIAL
jgi:ferric-dicitrate binding protein FerR (iron transport regulator)